MAVTAVSLASRSPHEESGGVWSLVWFRVAILILALHLHAYVQ